MGDASKRRDYAPIVKTIYNGMVEILLNEKDENKAVKFVMQTVQDMMNGNIDHNEFIISKTLRAVYKKRTTIAHAVLADRIKEREPGNAPQANDRVPYIYIPCFNKKKKVGENIEDPDYILANNMKSPYTGGIAIPPNKRNKQPLNDKYTVIIRKPTGNGKYWSNLDNEKGWPDILKNTGKDAFPGFMSPEKHPNNL